MRWGSSPRSQARTRQNAGEPGNGFAGGDEGVGFCRKFVMRVVRDGRPGAHVFRAASQLLETERAIESSADVDAAVDRRGRPQGSTAGVDRRGRGTREHSP
jgi:hypothetical protein